MEDRHHHQSGGNWRKFSLSPRLQELTDEFTARGGEWKEYPLSSLFYVERGTRYVKPRRKRGDVPLVTAGERNQGVAEFVRYDPMLKLYSGHITIDMFCNCFYRDYKFVCDDNILVLFPRVEIRDKSLLFIASIIDQGKRLYSYGKQYRQNNFQRHNILLPTLNGKIAFDFMEFYTRELEAERLCELDKYLATSGLNDTRLTQDEQRALQAFRDGKLAWDECCVKDLFEIKSNPQLNKESFVFSMQSEYPYFTRTSFNNGILGYVDYLDREHLIKGNSLAVGMIGMQFFYMEHDFYAGQFTKTACPRFVDFDERTALYFIALLDKFQKKYQSVLVRDFESTFYDSRISLPVRNGKIDFAFMRDFISAQEKLAIKGVIDWKDKVIVTTKASV